MQHSRFIIVETAARPAASDLQPGRLLWRLVSSNNRQLGQDVSLRETYAECRAAVTRLQRDRALLRAHSMTSEIDGQWSWQLSHDGVPVAGSSRAYLRARECEYNLQRFLEALAEADLVGGVRRLGARPPARPLADPVRRTDHRGAADMTGSSERRPKVTW